MLAEAAIWVVAVTTVVSTIAFTLDDIRPESQGEPPNSPYSKRPNPFELGLVFSGSPGQTRTADQVVNSHPLYQLSYRGSFRSPSG